MEAHRRAWQERIYPELKRIAPERREAASRRAGETSFDAFELLGMAVGIVVTALLSRYLAGEWVGNRRDVSATLHLGFALPMLPFALAPFHVRRVRRGLRSQIQSDPHHRNSQSSAA